MEEKNIDRLFQEKLKDLEVTPSDAVWNNIEAKLTNKKKKRIFPIWWFSSGVAAAIVLGLLLYPYGNKQEVIENTDTVVESTSSESKENSNTQKDVLPPKSIKEVLNETQIVKVKPNSKNSKNSHKTEEVLATNQNVKRFEKKSQKTDNEKADKTKKTLLANNNDIEQEDTSNTPSNIDAKGHLKNKKDSLIQDFKKKKDFLAAVQKEEKTPKEIIKKKQWSVAPTVAVLSSNSFTTSSPIDESLSNSTQGNTSYSYGLQVAYQLNKKWTIQSGVHLQEMLYSNTNVAVNPVTSSSSNVDFASGKSYALNDASRSNFDSSTVSLSSGSLDGQLNQKYGYIEVPLEVKYSVFESRKLKTQLVAGFSSLFLNKNDIKLTTSAFSSSGEANNLSNINFSGNLGVDVNYQFSKNWSLNINPMLKTQLNTFDKNSNGFQPYFIGIYTGINYQF